MAYQQYSLIARKLYSPNFYTLAELHEASLFVLRTARPFRKEDIKRAKRCLRGDVARRRERLTEQRAMEIIAIRNAAQRARKLAAVETKRAA